MRTVTRRIPPERYHEYIAGPEWETRKAWWRDHRSAAERRCRVCASPPWLVILGLLAMLVPLWVVTPVGALLVGVLLWLVAERLASGDGPYDLHHRTYVRLGCERLRDLVPLCRRHHEALHAYQRARHMTVERGSRWYLWAARARHLVVPAALAVAVILL